jgi:hypothetical protein
MIVLVNPGSWDVTAANRDTVVHSLHAIYTTESRQRVMGDTTLDMEAS